MADSDAATGRLPDVLRALPDAHAPVHDDTAPTAVGGLPALMRLLGYEFRRPALLRVALTLGSWANEHRSQGWPSNACLEFFGDAVLDLVAADALWRRFPELAEGELTRLRAALVSEASLARAAETIDLGAWLYLGRGDLLRGGRQTASTMADAVEAVLGAIFLDAREAGAEPTQAAEGAFDRLLGARLRALSPDDALDAKSRLQQWAQAKHRVTPTYVRVGPRPPPDAPQWHAQVELRFSDGRTLALGAGHGRSLKRAEQAAAAAALLEHCAPATRPRDGS